MNWARRITILKAQRADTMFMFAVRQRTRDGEIPQERDRLHLPMQPPPLPGHMVPLTPHHHPDSRLLTDIPDPGARMNPDSRDTSTITMLEMDLFPVYLGSKRESLTDSPSLHHHTLCAGP